MAHLVGQGLQTEDLLGCPREYELYGSLTCRTMTLSWREHWPWREDSHIESATNMRNLPAAVKAPFQAQRKTTSDHASQMNAVCGI